MPVTPHPESAPSLPQAEVRRLDDAAARLVDVATHSLDPAGGFGWLDDAGRLTPGRPAETWVTCRMTHTFALAHLHGDARRGRPRRPRGPGAAHDAARRPPRWLAVGRGQGGRWQGGVCARLRRPGRVLRDGDGSPGRPRPARRRARRHGRPVLGRERGARRRPVGRVVDPPRPLPRRQRQHAHGRVVPRRGRRHGRPGLARPGDRACRPGSSTASRGRTTGGCPSTSTSSGGRCSTTTSTTPATRSSPTA